MSVNNVQTWKPEQLKYIRFLAAGRRDTTGRLWTNDEYAKVLGVSPQTLSRWKADVRFRMAILDETMGRFSDFIPAMVSAQTKKAMGKGDTQAFMAVMRQAGLLKSDKQEVEHKGELGITINTVDFSNAQ